MTAVTSLSTARENHTAFSGAPASFVSPFLTKRVSLLSIVVPLWPLDKSTGKVAGDVDMNDFGGGSTDGLVSTAGGLLWAGVGCAKCSYDNDYGG